MDSLKQLDAQCVASMVGDSPITFAWGGVDYTGTTGARDTMSELVDGGKVNNQEFRILVATAAFGDVAPPGERAKVEVCLDAHGIPCSADEEISRVSARITAIGRAGGGLTFTIATDQRG